MRRPLPDPEWADPEFCVCCGYCLTGLSAPSRCPECGTPFLEKTLVLHGVPRSAAGTSPIRRVAWVLLIVAAGTYSQIWAFLLIRYWVLAVIFACGLVGGLVGLLLTSRRERGGAERFVVSPVGIVRLPLENPGEHERLDSVVLPWGDAMAVDLRRISPVWYRLRIGAFAPGGRVTSAIVDAGIRCTDLLAPEVRRTIEGHLTHAQQASQAELPSA